MTDDERVVVWFDPSDVLSAPSASAAPPDLDPHRVAAAAEECGLDHEDPADLEIMGARPRR